MSFMPFVFVEDLDFTYAVAKGKDRGLGGLASVEVLWIRWAFDRWRAGQRRASEKREWKGRSR